MRTLSESEKQIITESGLFDPQWYSSEYPDVSYSGLEPLDHFLRIGIKLGRNPCGLFDRQFYLAQFNDPSKLPECPLLDYLQEGWRQQRNPHPLFDLARYLDQNEDIKSAGIEPLGHYLSRGISEGRQLGPTAQDALDSMQFPIDDQPNSPASREEHATNRQNEIGHSPEEKAPLFKSNIENAQDNFIRGWCVNLNQRGDVFEVEVFLDQIFFTTTRNKESRMDLKNARLSHGLGGIIFPNPAAYLDEGKHSISLRFPDGTFSEAFEVEGKRSTPDRIRITDRIPHRPVTIIVPIHNAAEDLRICIERLLAYTPEFAKILLIDDCSTDPKIAEILSLHEKTSNIRILKNSENCGFTRTVNRGIEEAAEEDVVLLNSDARVTPRWLESMLVAAYSAPRIATVTAMSDRAGAFSAPQMGNDNKLPEGVDEISYARAFRRRSLGLYPRVPTGNGFCMFINRDCIKSIGMLDAQAFPRGYGEENDFCMRAVRAGWQHIIDDCTYVFHDRSKSFGEAKTELLVAGRTVVDERYPEYGKAIRVFRTCNKIAAARYRARLAVQDCTERPEKAWIPRVLFVVSTKTGGTPQTNRDLMQALCGVIEGWVLRCDSKILELSRMDHDGNLHTVQSRRLLEPVDSLTHNSSEYDTVVSSWLQGFDFDLVHIRHLGWHGLSLPRLARQLGAKVIYSFHDFYALSSTFKLIDDTSVFLGNTYLAEGSVYRESLWPKDALPTPHGTWLAFWRERFQAALEHCEAFITTADSARQVILDAMPRLQADRFVVIPHGRNFTEFHRIRQKPSPREPLRILVPGHIQAVKGLEIIRALIEHDEAGRLEFHILGRLIGEKPKKGIVTHGAYERHKFAEKAREVQPHLGIIFSVWDETYCHTLTELWSVGLPAAVLDFPNVADRVRRSGAGWVLDHRQISKLYEEILRIAFDEREYERTEQALEDWQAGYGRANSAEQMAAGYLNIYSDVLCEGGEKKRPLSPQSRKRVAVVCPASPDLRQDPSSTHIRVWERTRNSVERNVTYLRMTPDMLIASAREKMIDGAIIQRNAMSQDKTDNTIHTLDQARIPYSLDLDDDLLPEPGPLFDKSLQLLLSDTSNKNGRVKKPLESNKNSSSPRIAVCAHVFYINRWEIITKYLQNIHHEYDLYLTCPTEIVPLLERATSNFSRLQIIPVSNIGMDVLPFLHAVHEHALWRYDAVLKLHTKNNKTEAGEILGRLLLDGVLGTSELVEKVLDELLYKNSIGMVGSECMYRSAPKVMKPNRPNVEKILDAIKVGWPKEEWGFFAGTMFWIRGNLLKILVNNYEEITSRFFTENSIAATGSDGKWAHALERVFGLLPKFAGKEVAVSFPVTENGKHSHIREISYRELNFRKKYSRHSQYYAMRYEKLSPWVNLCQSSSLFDKSFYQRIAGLLLPNSMNPATHFVLFGDVLGLDPSEHFSVSTYLETNVDVSNLIPSIPSLVHYLQHGGKEGRSISGVSS